MTSAYVGYMDRISDVVREWLGKGWTKGIDDYDAFLLIKKIVDEDND